MDTEKQILVVDDDDDVREAFVNALEDRGFRVVSATNGIEALKVLRAMAVRPSVILLDIMMPLMDGYEFLDEQRKDPALASIPVAVLSAGNAVDRTRVGDRVEVVEKPIKLSRLFSVVQSLQLRAAMP